MQWFESHKVTITPPPNPFINYCTGFIVFYTPVKSIQEKHIAKHITLT